MPGQASHPNSPLIKSFGLRSRDLADCCVVKPRRISWICLRFYALHSLKSHNLTSKALYQQTASSLTSIFLAGLILASCVTRSTRAQEIDPQPAAEAAKGPQINCPTTDELETLFKPLEQIQIRQKPTAGQLPIDCSAELFGHPTDEPTGRITRDWADTEFHWMPTELSHQPLYFDDVPLEHYGQSVAPLLQPALSGARFFATLPVLPYKIGLNHPFEHVTTLGTYRPGSPAPSVRQTLPLDLEASFFEGGAWVGLLFLLP